MFDSPEENEWLASLPEPPEPALRLLFPVLTQIPSQRLLGSAVYNYSNETKGKLADDEHCEHDCVIAGWIEQQAKRHQWPLLKSPQGQTLIWGQPYDRVVFEVITFATDSVAIGNPVYEKNCLTELDLARWYLRTTEWRYGPSSQRLSPEGHRLNDLAGYIETTVANLDNSTLAYWCSEKRLFAVSRLAQRIAQEMSEHDTDECDIPRKMRRWRDGEKDAF